MCYFLSLHFESAKIGIFCVTINILKQKVSQMNFFMSKNKFPPQTLRRIGGKLLLLSQISLNENRTEIFSVKGKFIFQERKIDFATTINP